MHSRQPQNGSPFSGKMVPPVRASVCLWITQPTNVPFSSTTLGNGQHTRLLDPLLARGLLSDLSVERAFNGK
jgi:hypothetical protein